MYTWIALRNMHNYDNNLCVLVLENYWVFSSYSKQADNNIYVSVKKLNLLYYEGTNKEQTVSTETDHGVGAQYYKEIPIEQIQHFNWNANVVVGLLTVRAV